MWRVKAKRLWAEHLEIAEPAVAPTKNDSRFVDISEG